MKIKMYSLYSNAQCRFNIPFFASDESDENEAKAYVVKLVSQGDTALWMALSDFYLYEVAEFDSDVGSECPVNGGSIRIETSLHENLPYPPMVKDMIDKIYKKEEQK